MLVYSICKEDYKGWARGLRRAGYATDPKYPDKHIVYRCYNLGQYDALVMGKEYNSIERQIQE
jgi:flagellum-specific peptidoglycan hydrolase FlgJ